MEKVNEINNLNEAELDQGIAGTPASWHHHYRTSDAIRVNGLSPSIEKDRLVAILEQYGVVVYAHIVRDITSTDASCHAFVRYEDPRSCVLAVDNFTGIEVDGQTLCVEHVEEGQMVNIGAVATTPEGTHESQTTEAAHEHKPGTVEEEALCK